MTALATSRMIVPLAALAVVGGVALVFTVQHLRRGPSVEVKVASAVPAVSAPAATKPDREPAPLESAQAQANALISGLAGPPTLPKSDGAGEPTFDVARIEPTGEAVIAGRSTPGATVELLRNGHSLVIGTGDKHPSDEVAPPPQAMRDTAKDKPTGAHQPNS